MPIFKITESHGENYALKIYIVLNKVLKADFKISGITNNNYKTLNPRLWDTPFLLSNMVASINSYMRMSHPSHFFPIRKSSQRWKKSTEKWRKWTSATTSGTTWLEMFTWRWGLNALVCSPFLYNCDDFCCCKPRIYRYFKIIIFVLVFCSFVMKKMLRRLW